MDQPADSFSLDTLRRAFAPRPEPYAGVFMDEPRRIGGALVLIVSVVCLVLAVAAPPDAVDALGGSGWLVWAAGCAAGLAAGFAFLRPGSNAGFDAMFAATLVGTVFIATMVWLTGGIGSPYQQLFIAPGVLPPSIHPPRRALAILGATTLGLFAPLIYEDWSGAFAAATLVQAVFIWMLALITMVVINSVREQRLGLIGEGEEARRQARSDPLTGLGNRLAFDETLAREIARTRRSGSPLSLLILDLDRFKHINDTHGHPTGDLALRTVADAMTDEVRQPDACFRWGGDEFALLLPDTARDSAFEVGERLLAAVAARQVLPGGDRISFTFGVAQLRRWEEPGQLLDEADATLYAAKREAAADASNSGRE